MLESDVLVVKHWCSACFIIYKAHLFHFVVTFINNIIHNNDNKFHVMTPFYTPKDTQNMQYKNKNN